MPDRMANELDPVERTGFGLTGFDSLPAGAVSTGGFGVRSKISRNRRSRSRLRSQLARCEVCAGKLAASISAFSTRGPVQELFLKIEPGLVIGPRPDRVARFHGKAGLGVNARDRKNPHVFRGQAKHAKDKCHLHIAGRQEDGRHFSIKFLIQTMKNLKISRGIGIAN